MILTRLKRKRTLFVLFLLFFSCQSKCPRWFLETTKGEPCFYSSKLNYPPQDSLNGLELELIQGPTGSRMYINIFAIPFSSDKDEIPIEITAQEEKSIVYASLLEGGQRLLLSQEAKEKIVNLLLNYEAIFIKVGRYSAEILSSRFFRAQVFYNS